MTWTAESKVRLVFSLILLGLLVPTLLTTGLLWWVGNWEQHEPGLTRTLRIVWACWVVLSFATLLTRVTIFGWTFRNYLRWPEEEEGPPPDLPRRPTRAPWIKSGAASFAITVVMVSLTASTVTATAVLWILEDVIGSGMFWLVFKVLWSFWWVACITTVLVRVSLFGRQRARALRETREEKQP